MIYDAAQLRTPAPGAAAGAGLTTSRISVPGTGASIVVERDEATGALRTVRADDRTYLRATADGRTVFDDGFVVFRETKRSDGFDREVFAGDHRWVERYRWGEDGKLREVDGVRVHRDERGRVIGMVDGAGGSAATWTYAYGARGLASIVSPGGRRILGRDGAGRIRAMGENGITRSFQYDAAGVRRDARRLPGRRYHRDPAGRVWAVTGPRGDVLCVYLWDGHRCLARIDGAPGEPLAAVFSLDPSATPVRVIGRDRVIRVPRDAFGEALLQHDRVPGLFGGVVADGLVHLPLRAVDPLTGSFCAPDPLHGGPGDPRRGERGVYTGPLPAEATGPWSGEATGPLSGRATGPFSAEATDPMSGGASHPGAWGQYAVCRGDPVGRGDPTGGISGWLVFSDLTWSLQNNLVSFFGIDWWFNLFASLFTGFQLGDFGSSEGLTSSDRLGSFAVRRDGFLAWLTGGRAFTTQHIVWSPASEFEDLQRAFVVDPRGVYEPTLYGTLLRGRPKDEQPFLLRGMRDAGGGFANAGDWSRQGGRASPVCPGGVVPRFPAGGFHLPNALTTLAPRPCPLDELAPGGRVALGTLERRATMLLPVIGTLPAEDDLVLLSDGGGDLLITRVVSSSLQGTQQLVRFDDDAPAVGPAGVTVTLLQNAPASSEVRGAEPAVTNGLTAAGATATYAARDLLRLTSGTDVTAARVDRLEARLPLDRPLPGGMTGPIQLRRTTVAPTGASVPVAGADRLDFSAASPPAAGTMGLVRGSGQEIPVVVVDASDPARVQLDRDISAAGAGPVDYFRVTAGAALGTRAGAAEPESRVTYTPQAPGVAPDGAAGTTVLRFEGTGGPAARRVTGAPTYDAVVLDRAIAGAGPWTVERFLTRPGTRPIENRGIISAASLVAEPAAAVDGADALRLDRVAAAATPGVPDAATALYSGLTLAGDHGTGSFAPGAQKTAPRPGHVVLLTGAGTATPVVVTRVRVAPTFDRVVPVTGDGVQAVLLRADGFRYEAERLAADRLVVHARAEGPGGLVDVAFPRFGVGETVEVSWGPGGAGGRERVRVAAVSGTTLSLEGGGPVPSVTDARVQRLVPDDPGNGSSFLARDGEAGAAPGARIDFSVWQPDAFAEDSVVGIVQGDRTWPAVVTAASQDLRVDFGADPGLSGTADLAPVTVLGSVVAGRFVRDGDALLIADDTTGIASAAGELVLVTGYRDAGNTAAGAALSAGTLLVPEDETVEIDRRQSLTDHELTHTLQYSRWGPLWFCYFPMLLLELPVELATDAERPEFGPFFDGTLTAAGHSWDLALADGADPGLSVGDTVQIVQGASAVDTVVRGVDGRTLHLRTKDGSAVPPTGAVHARHRHDGDVWSGIVDALQLFTHGGLLNSVVGTTWGGILWALGKLFWGLGRAIGGSGDLYPASVQGPERRLVRLTSAEGQSGLADATQVIIRQGDVTVVRSGGVAGDLLTLQEPLTFDGDVQVARYASLDPGNAFAWFSYHAATVPDPDNPFRIEVPGHGGDFHEQDRIEIRYRDQTFRSYVMRVDGDAVEIEDRVPVTGGETSLRVAVVGASDPMGQADSYLATELGMGWMRWLFDPWGRIGLAVGPDPAWLNMVLRVVRYLVGTQMWSMLPVLGYVFYGRFFVAEHLARIEQEASQESGDLYTPLSRVTGEVRGADGFGNRELVVGDVARLRNWTLFRASSLIDATFQDGPGVHRLSQRLRVVVDRAPTAAAAEPNGAVETGGTDPAAALYDRFTAKNPSSPRGLASATNPLGFVPSALGYIPDAPTTVRHVGGYAAFTRPGSHRLTVENDIDPSGTSASQQAQEAREAQDRERQTVFFDVTARDVVVQVNGQAVADGGTIRLVHTQEALVTVAPDGVEAGARRFRATVTRPDDGPVLRIRNDRRLLAQDTDGAGEPVEVCRFYAFDPATGSYADPSLAAFGTHLGGDLYIPVRRFTVDVVATVPLRGSADPAAAALTELAQGAEGVLLVPTALRGAVSLTRIDGHAPGAGDPVPAVTRVDDPGEAVRAFLGTAGVAFTVRFPADPAVAGTVPVVLSIPVGVPGGLTSTLTASFDLVPA